MYISSLAFPLLSSYKNTGFGWMGALLPRWQKRKIGQPSTEENGSADLQCSAVLLIMFSLERQPWVCIKHAFKGEMASNTHGGHPEWLKCPSDSTWRICTMGYCLAEKWNPDCCCKMQEKFKMWWAHGVWFHLHALLRTGMYVKADRSIVTKGWRERENGKRPWLLMGSDFLVEKKLKDVRRTRLWWWLLSSCVATLQTKLQH